MRRKVEEVVIVIRCKDYPPILSALIFCPSRGHIYSSLATAGWGRRKGLLVVALELIYSILLIMISWSGIAAIKTPSHALREMARAEVCVSHGQRIFSSLEANRTDVLGSEVKLAFLPPYSPDLNPIEEFFAELKAFIRRNWHSYEDNPDQGFDTFLEWCVDIPKQEQRY
ncbi:hypothetical protein N7530_006023 [Penicillium desertorum]|uniref:Tc1-like transposase DDE domain-containing protein n=1 Tax=Penicillium desertorum TaxID=1303715 RepID=A0A9X0BRX5_9EURO|nr:hypothetical protein N7530_006023 [Penicillium desertorum]